MIPLLVLAGEAGSGKDTVAGAIAGHKEVACLAYADPMKRFCKDVFGFTMTQLWGPSEVRGEPDEAYDSVEAWNNAHYNLGCVAHDWLAEVLSDVGDRSEPLRQLYRWYRELVNQHVDVVGQQVLATLTPRTALQTLGTQWGRAVDPDMWVRYAMDAAWKLLKGGWSYSCLSGLHQNAGMAPLDWVVVTDARMPNEVLLPQLQGAKVVKVVDPKAQPKELVGGVPGHATEKLLRTVPDHYFTATLLNDKTLGLDCLRTQVEDLVVRLEGRYTSSGPGLLGTEESGSAL